MVESVEDLDVFRMSHQLAIRVYALSRGFPREELYGLTSQLRRAASSVAANLAEGANRNSRAEYRSFIGIAKGSAGEVRYHLLLARDLGYMSTEEAEGLRTEYARVIRMLTGLVKTLEKRKRPE